MLSVKKSFSFVLASIFILSLALSGCSSLPWSTDKDDEDLFFEEDFGSEFEDVSPANKDKETVFLKDDKKQVQSKAGAETPSESVPVSPDEEDFFFEDDEKLTQSKSKAEPKPKTGPSTISSEEDDIYFDDEPMAHTILKPKLKLNPQQGKIIEQRRGVISSEESGVPLGRSGGGFVSVDQKTDKEEFKVDVATLHRQQEALLLRVQELQKIVSNLEPRLTATQERVDASM
jgi:hypothetical protein